MHSCLIYHNLAIVLIAFTTQVLHKSFFFDFPLGTPGEWALITLTAGMESTATARHSGFIVEMDSTLGTHTSCAWKTSDSQCRSLSTRFRTHGLSMILLRNKNIIEITGSIQAQLGCPSSAQLEVNIQGTIAWLYTAPDNPLKPN